MAAVSSTTLELLTGGGRTVLTGTLGAPRLRSADYAESEWLCRGTAVSYASAEPLGSDGRWHLVERDAATFATRAVVRRPVDPGACSGTVVVEWLNVSSGADAAPLYGFLAPELLRRGHVWVGVSAQWAGVVPAPPLVSVGGGGPAGLRLAGLQDADPQRYGVLHHPGDAYCYDVFTQVAARAVAADSPVLGDVEVRRVLAVGESQSGYALTTYIDGVQPLTGCFDGFLVHSRGGPAMPLGEPGTGVDLEAGRDDAPVRIRTDVDVPVVVVETETDLLGHLRFLPARQDDGERFRLWEVAGAAHADRSIVGEFEELLGCVDPVNRGQQRFVVRAALRHLDTWAGGGPPPPTAPRLEIDGDDGIERAVEGDSPRFVTDDVGNVLGGVRTPCVEAPVEVLSGLAAPGSSRICQLFGRSLPASPEALRRRYRDEADYRRQYERAAEAAVAAGFVLVEDREELLGDARPDLVDW